VVTERIVDVPLMLTLFFITLAVQFSELTGLTNEYITEPLKKKLSGSANMLYILTASIILFIMILVFFRKKIKNLLTGKMGAMLKNFGEGLRSVKDVKSPALFIFQSFLIWFCYLLSLYVCFWCFDETRNLGIKPALVILLLGTVGVAVSPGGIGLYQIISTGILVFYGVTNGVQTSFPWIVWGAQFISIIVIGGLCFLLLPLLNRDKDGLSQST